MHCVLLDVDSHIHVVQLLQIQEYCVISCLIQENWIHIYIDITEANGVVTIMHVDAVQACDLVAFQLQQHSHYHRSGRILLFDINSRLLGVITVHL